MVSGAILLVVDDSLVPVDSSGVLMYTEAVPLNDPSKRSIIQQESTYTAPSPLFNCLLLICILLYFSLPLPVPLFLAIFEHVLLLLLEKLTPCLSCWLIAGGSEWHTVQVC